METAAMNLARTALNNPASVIVTAILILLFGVISLFKLPSQITPDIEQPQISVFTGWRSAAPQEVEEGIVDKIEESLRSLNGIKKIRSNAVEGLATVRAEIASNYDVQEVMDEIKTQVSAISSLPEQTEKVPVQSF